MESKLKKVDRFVVSPIVLYRSSLGLVYKGYLHSDPSLFVAVKIVDIGLLQTSLHSLHMLKRETDLLQKIDHENIQQLYSVAKTNSNFYLFHEYCEDGTFEEYLKDKGGYLSQGEALHFFIQLLSAFEKLYDLNISHFNVQPANIFMQEGVLKIGEFSYAKFLNEDKVQLSSLINSFSPYTSPQILENSEISPKSDIWSLGILFYDMLYRDIPWKGKTPVQVLDNMKNQKLVIPDNPEREMIIQNLLIKMLKFSDTERISWVELISNKSKLEELQNPEAVNIELEEDSSLLASSAGVVSYIMTSKVMDVCKLNRIKEFITKESSMTVTRKSKRKAITFKNLQGFLEHHENQIRNNLISKEIDGLLMKRRNICLFISNFDLSIWETYHQVKNLEEKERFAIQLLSFLLKKISLNILLEIVDELEFRVKSEIDHSKFLIYIESSEYENTKNLLTDELSIFYQIFNEKKVLFYKIISELKESSSYQEFSTEFELEQFLKEIETLKNAENQEFLFKFLQREQEIRNKYLYPQTKKFKQLEKFSSIMRNPMKYFENPRFDFFKFYEEMERL